MLYWLLFNIYSLWHMNNGCCCAFFSKTQQSSHLGSLACDVPNCKLKCIIYKNVYFTDLRESMRASQLKYLHMTVSPVDQQESFSFSIQIIYQKYIFRVHMPLGLIIGYVAREYTINIIDLPAILFYMYVEITKTMTLQYTHINVHSKTNCY